MANVEILAIGSELLLGQIVDTNSTWIAKRLSNHGLNLFFKTVVGDNPGRMKQSLVLAMNRSDVVITSGGLGPTQDDITREIVSEALGINLTLDQKLLSQIKQRFQDRGLIMTKNNERQAYIPQEAIPIENPNGTAPAFIVEKGNNVVISLPGVPFELKWLFENEVIPYLTRKFNLREIITYRVLKVTDMGESSVDDKIGHLIANSKNPTVGVLAHPGQVDIRIAAKAQNQEEAEALIEPIDREIRNLLGNHIFGIDANTMESATGDLIDNSESTISVYEDLTGGLIANSLQKASPKYFNEGIIGNKVDSIRRLLSISQSPSDTATILNDPLALTDELASSIRVRTNANLGLAVHGILGTNRQAKNYGHGKTFMSITNGKGFRRGLYNTDGYSIPDQTRTSLNAIALVRTTLLKGIPTAEK